MSSRKDKHNLSTFLLLISSLTLHTFLTNANAIEEDASKSSQPAEPANLQFDYRQTARSLGRSLTQCLRNVDILDCVENEILFQMSKAVEDNSTWHYGDFLQVEKLHDANTNNSISKYLARLQQQRQKRSFGDLLSEKLWSLMNNRALRFQLPQQLQYMGISDTLDDFVGDGTLTTNDVATDEGRKKKDKDKNMAMMGGMAMMAMFAQMFLGKVILIAGAAFIMAKIALVISLLGSLKKGTSGSHPGSTEHVIVAGSSGGHSHESSGWHRSMPYEYSSTHHTEHPPSMHDDIHPPANDDFHPQDLTLPPPNTNSHNEFAPYSRIDANPSIHQRKRYKYQLTANDLNNYKQQLQPLKT